MQGLYKEGEYRKLEFWTWKSYVRDTYSAHLQMSWNFTENYFGINKKYWKKEMPEEATQVPTRHQGAPTPWACPGGLWGPWPASGAHLLVYKLIFPSKNKERTFETECRRLKAELGQEHFCSPVVLFRRDTSLPAGEVETIVITNNPLIVGGPIFINIFNSTISSQNCSPTLVFNLCMKTLDWYLWVTSSVDYIL